MVYNISYRRPAHVESSASSISHEQMAQSIAESVHSNGSSLSGIPDALSFDRIIAGGTCPPCTTRDFMNYLIYIERAAENLQFFLWYRDYSKRFAALPETERKLSPEWSLAEAEAEAAQANAQTQATGKSKISPETAEVFKGTDFATPSKIIGAGEPANPFSTPPQTSHEKSDASPWGGSNDGASSVQTRGKSIAQKAAGAFEGADLKWQPFTIQPFREEIARIIATYIADGSPRELNLSGRERSAILHALENTTHPSAFGSVIVNVEWSLRFQAHPNFIRWTICNGNRPRVIFARGLGVGGIVGGIIAAIIITLSGAGRGWRVLAAIGFIIGVSTLIAAWKGMCVVLHGMHHRHLRPWELFASEEDGTISEFDMKKESFESFGSSNSYEDEPWVAKYEKRNLIRKVFDREVWIQEPALRQIQDTIFLQAIGGSIIISAVAVGIFVALPKGNYF
ncbi:MAG: hypothetical protein M1829_003679 [Trizodia sp. TS-e1964]|nr:MAG: hypothetical protein M1829_003679 [Trizodia sp. TS-e1964]